MDHATHLWAWGLSLLSAFTPAFTRPGWDRFVQWVTGLVLGWEAQTLTQILTALGLESRWRVLEHFAAYGSWDRAAVERHLLRVIEQEQPARWGQYHPVAVDDTTLHRTSTQVWGTCTFHEARARSPHRAETVRAHHWVVMGTLLPGRPWTYLPHAARLYCRATPWPAGDPFRTTTALAVERLRQAEAEAAAPILGVFDGAYAVATVIRPGLEPGLGQRPVAIVTRRRAEARLYHPVGPQAHGKGRPAPGGPRIAAPRHPVYWPTTWQSSRAWVYGRRRQCRYKQLRCCWAVRGPQIPSHVCVVEMAGDEAPWFLVTSAVDLSAAQVVGAWTARSRQEDGFRDHKPRLGMEECRAWTQEPSLRTFQVHLVALSLLRLRHARRDQTWGTGTWWHKPAWNHHQRQASILDLRRLVWRYRAEFSQFLVTLEESGKITPPPGLCQNLTEEAA